MVSLNTIGNLITAGATVGLFIAAAYGFHVNRKVVRLQTSMDFCAMIYPVLQSEEFVAREQYLIYTLTERRKEKPACSIYKIDNDTLRCEILRYCECLNGIGLLLYEHMINADVIIPYIGTKSTVLYELIRPYLDITRHEMAEIQYDFFSLSQNEKIQNAAALYFVHYELLALQMRDEGPKVTKDFNKQLKKNRSKNQIYETYK